MGRPRRSRFALMSAVWGTPELSNGKTGGEAVHRESVLFRAGGPFGVTENFEETTSDMARALAIPSSMTSVRLANTRAIARTLPHCPRCPCCQQTTRRMSL
jgi:hypothetical protein